MYNTIFKQHKVITFTQKQKMNSYKQLTLSDIKEAHRRIESFITRTPLVSSPLINEKLNNNIYFKIESLQKTGAFKIRGVFNKLLSLKEQNLLPNRIVTFSSGNHGKGLSYACKELGIDDVTVYMTHNSSPLKQKAIKSLGGKITLKETRDEIYEAIEQDVKKGATYVATSNDDLIIAGQGTSCLGSFGRKARNRCFLYAMRRWWIAIWNISSIYIQ